jgi:DNA-binding LacI/PurR family transcriptional regulator
LTIGVVAPFVPHPSMVERLKGIVSGLAASRYDLVLFDVEAPEHREQHLHHLTRTRFVDGLLLVSLVPSGDEVDRVHEAGVRTVLLDARHESLPRVVIDDAQGGRLATEHLLGLGHRRIAFVGDWAENPYGFTSSRDRQAGYAEALRAAGIEPEEDLLKQGAHGRHQARELARELFRLPAPPTAIFAASDTQALGVVEAAREAGLEVPGDVSVIGFDDIERAELVSLTTVRQPLRESGRLAAELVLRALENGSPEPEETVLPLELVLRTTTGPARKPVKVGR